MSYYYYYNYNLYYFLTSKLNITKYAEKLFGSAPYSGQSSNRMVVKQTDFLIYSYSYYNNNYYYCNFYLLSPLSIPNVLNVVIDVKWWKATRNLSETLSQDSCKSSAVRGIRGRFHCTSAPWTNAPASVARSKNVGWNAGPMLGVWKETPRGV